jgi:biotin carboxyl carrier protein
MYIADGEADVSFNNENYFAKLSPGNNGFTNVQINGKIFEMKRTDIAAENLNGGSSTALSGGGNNITSPMPGKVFKLHVQEGDIVSKGDVLLIIESMKMENRILATKDAVVQKINIALHDMIEASTVLVVLDDIKENNN